MYVGVLSQFCEAGDNVERVAAVRVFRPVEDAIVDREDAKMEDVESVTNNFSEAESQNSCFKDAREGTPSENFVMTTTNGFSNGVGSTGTRNDDGGGDSTGSGRASSSFSSSSFRRNTSRQNLRRNFGAKKKKEKTVGKKRRARKNGWSNKKRNTNATSRVGDAGKTTLARETFNSVMKSINDFLTDDEEECDYYK